MSDSNDSDSQTSNTGTTEEYTKPAFAEAVQKARQIAARIRYLQESSGSDSANCTTSDTERPLENSINGVAASGQVQEMNQRNGSNAEFIVENYHVPDKMVDLIIGHCGEQINRLQSETGCKMQLTSDSGGSSERLCTLTGPRKAVQAVKEMIDEISQKANSPFTSEPGHVSDGQYITEMMIPTPKVGLLIGKGKENLTNLQEKGGVKMVFIQDGPKQMAHEKPLWISGDPQKVELAKQMVLDLLAQKEMENSLDAARNSSKKASLEEKTPSAEGSPSPPEVEETRSRSRIHSRSRSHSFLRRRSDSRSRNNENPDEVESESQSSQSRSRSRSYSPRRSYSPQHSPHHSYYDDHYGKHGGKRRYSSWYNCSPMSSRRRHVGNRDNPVPSRYSRSYSRRRSYSPQYRRHHSYYDDHYGKHGGKGQYSSRYNCSPMSSRRRHVRNRDNPEPSRRRELFYTQERELDVSGKYGPIEDVQVVYDSQRGYSNGRGASSQEEIIVPRQAGGVAIGKDGDMFKRIQQDSGARVQFIQGKEDIPGDKLCQITGSMDQVQKAASLMTLDLIQSVMIAATVQTSDCNSVISGTKRPLEVSMNGVRTSSQKTSNTGANETAFADALQRSRQLLVPTDNDDKTDDGSNPMEVESQGCQGLSEPSKNYFEKLFDSKVLCDATLKFKNEEIPVHRCVLAIHSTVFAEIFQSDIAKKNSGIVEIQEFHPAVFKAFLRYLYCGKADNKEFSDNIHEMYRIGHQYDVPHLMSHCIAFIGSNLSLDNLYNSVLLADRYNVKELMPKIQNFFVDKFADIVCTEKWEAFLKSHLQLANKLLKSLAKTNANTNI